VGVREDKREAAWHAIRDAAWRLFDERGYAAVSVEEIAAAAGVSRTTFFNYFGLKEGVVLDPAPAQVRRLESLARDQPADLAPWAALTAVLVGLVEGVQDDLVTRRRLLGAHPELAHRGRELTDELAGSLRGWMRTRLPQDALGADLLVDLALAAVGTAWSTWPEDAPVTAYVALLGTCLARAAPPWAT